MDKINNECWVNINTLLDCNENDKKMSVIDYMEKLFSVFSNDDVMEKCKGKVFAKVNYSYSVYDFRDISLKDNSNTIEYKIIDLTYNSFNEYKCNTPITNMEYKTLFEISGKELYKLSSMIDIVRENADKTRALIKKCVDDISKMDGVVFDFISYDTEHINLCIYDKDMTIGDVISEVLSASKENYNRFKALNTELKGCYVLQKRPEEMYRLMKFKGARDKFVFNTDCIYYEDINGLLVSNDIPFTLNNINLSGKTYKIGRNKEMDKYLDSFFISLHDCIDYLNTNAHINFGH